MTDAAPPRANRRISARRACLLTVRYRVRKSWHPATALDLSADGCRLRLGEDLVHGSAVSVLFEAPLRDGATALSAEAVGTVTWSRLDGLSHAAGIQFAAAPSALHELLASIA
ncbi:MAG: PilZ domain-containing protein [Vicinamibacteria bacterium]